MVVAEIVACGLAVVVAVYAGLLLQTLAGVRLWSSPWVPALFALSAASCGCALLMAGALFRGGRRGAFGRRCAGRRPRRCGRHRGGGGGGCGASRLRGWEAITRACEASADEPACTARRRCPGGLAFVACGLAAPFAVEVGCLVRGRVALALGRGLGREGVVPFRSLGRIPLRPWLWRPPSCSWALWACAPRWWRPVPSVPLELQEAEAPASVPSENEEAAGLRSAPSAEESGARRLPQRKERT